MVLFIALSGCMNSEVPQQSHENTRVTPTDESFIRQGTPQETIFSYFEVINSGDIELMRKLVDTENKSNQIFLKGFEEMMKQGLRIEVTDISLYVVEETGDMVRIQTNHQQKMTDNGRVVFDTESGSSFTLVRKGDKWFFIGLGAPIPPGWIIE